MKPIYLNYIDRTYVYLHVHITLMFQGTSRRASSPIWRRISESSTSLRVCSVAAA